MMDFREGVGIVWVGIALCMPGETVGQTIAAALTTAPAPPASPAVSPETTKRLDGRLFFSVEERQRLDDARKRGLVIGDDGQPVQAPPSVLNGFVKRSDGQITIWLDGQARNNQRSLNARELQPQDVCGNADAIKVLDSYVAADISKPKMRPKPVKKPVSQLAAAKRAAKK